MTNSQCIGYVILSLEALKYPPERINEITLLMRSAFDEHTEEEAQNKYVESPY